MEASVLIKVFWNMTPCKLVHKVFRSTFVLLATWRHQVFSEKLVPVYFYNVLVSKFIFKFWFVSRRLEFKFWFVSRGLELKLRMNDIF